MDRGEEEAGETKVKGKTIKEKKKKIKGKIIVPKKYIY